MPTPACDSAAMAADELAWLATEGIDAALADLDQMPTPAVVRALLEGHDAVLRAVEAVADDVAALADAAAERLARRGRVVYVGAGTGGRVAQLDAAEWGPTFGVAEGTVVALLAGAGLPSGSLAEAAAEDDAAAGAGAVSALAPGRDDVVVAVSASGRTPFVLGAVHAAQAAGALTAGISCQRGAALSQRVAMAIEVPVGPEVIAGSTRLKAGTAQKLIINAFSTAVMVRRGRTLGNLMAGMHVANSKLRARAARVCAQATGCSLDDACAALAAAGDDLPTAIVSVANGVAPSEARRALDAADGVVRRALKR